MTKRLLIIGGSDAGISAALQARQSASDWDVTLLLKDSFPNYSICGLPFFLSGEVADWRHLAHRRQDQIEVQGIRVLTDHMAERIDATNRTVIVNTTDGSPPAAMRYDRLLIATGAESARPPITGMDLPGVFSLRWITDGLVLKDHIEKHRPKSIAIIGGGYIGMEMADAMRRIGLTVSVIEYLPSILTTLDPSLGGLVRSELERNGVRVVTATAVTSLVPENKQLLVQAYGGFESKTDMVLVAAGSRPNAALAQSAGISLGVKGAIQVNRKMQTNLSGVYAAGDCAETYHGLLQRNLYLPLGTTAHKQGRIAGLNAVGGSCEYAGSLGTQSVKVFDLVAGRTGLKDDEARAEGLDPLSVDFETWDHKVYYPGAEKMNIRLTGDRRTGVLLGAQIVGHYGSEVSKRIDIAATAIFHRMSVADLSHLDLSYTPPLSSPWDPIQMAAQEWVRAA